jgi:hypothetical protein
LGFVFLRRLQDLSTTLRPPCRIFFKGMQMTPTPKLRFVEREISNPYEFELGRHIMLTKTIRILQQYWAPKDADKTQAHYKGEWRDVPVEKEQA